MIDETAGTRHPAPDVVARNARACRIASGLSTAQVAELAGLSEAWVTSLEEGRASWSRTSLTRLAAVFDTSVGHLVGAEPDRADAAPTVDSDARVLIAMRAEECYARLRLHKIGRVSPGGADPPFILPVNYVVDGRDIVFRTGGGSSLAPTAGPVAFEVDDLVVSARLGWSVLVVGQAERVADPAELRRLAAAELTPWPDGERTVWIRIRPDRVTGRRVAPEIRTT
jgi:nitroimidazol reductase NimA-like FMN-containing flavoprotein (pyridoxamine 5'-phosphate oxidase superfamily)